jgi:hypothetical protein
MPAENDVKPTDYSIFLFYNRTFVHKMRVFLAFKFCKKHRRIFFHNSLVEKRN